MRNCARVERLGWVEQTFDEASDWHNHNHTTTPNKHPGLPVLLCCDTHIGLQQCLMFNTHTCLIIAVGS